MSFITLRRKAAAWIGIVGALLGSIALSGGALAAITDIGNAPLFTSSTNAVKPNIMFILDDSGSMANDFLPDEAKFGSSGNTKYGKFASQCNGVAYNPDVKYTVPVDAAGTPAAPGSLSFITFDPTTTTTQRTLSAIGAMPAAATGTFTVTVTAGTAGSRNSSWYPAGTTLTVFQTGDASRYIVGDVVSWDKTSGTLVLDLTSDSGLVVGSGTMLTPKVGFGEPTGSTYYTYTGSQTPLSYTYTSSGVITTTTFYRECNSVVGSAPGNGVFTAVTVTSLSGEAQNYANWYQYYRTRMNMMKSSISLAFKGVDSRYRLGFSTISETTAVESTATNTFLNIRDYDTIQKGKFYTAFNAATPSSWTPLRGALSKAGQYYANKAQGQTVDPTQYSCQRNFTILSTDGYWNTPDENTTAPKYGPYKLDNTSLVGQQDGSGTLRPMLDGNSVSSTTTMTWTSTAVSSTTTVTPVTSVTTTTKTTSTYTPTSGFTESDYALSLKRAPATITRPVFGSTTITVTTSSPHNFGVPGTTTTAVVTQTGGTGVAGYTGTVVVTIVDATTIKYTSTTGSRPSSPSSASNYTIALQSAQSCTAGQGIAVKTTRAHDELGLSISTTTTTSTTFSTITAVATKTDKIPYSRVVKRQDGVLSNDTGDVAGLLVSTPTTTSTTVTSPITGTTTFVASTGPSSFTAWVTGTSSIVSACTTTVPATTTIANATTTSAFPGPSGGPTVTGPVKSTGTAVVTTTGPTTSLSSVVTSTSSISTGGVSNSLADVAAYYYNTDLRNSSLGNCTGTLGTDICNNNVPGNSGDAAHSYGDNAAWQHMTTFTLGLGVSGLLKYDPNYQTQLSGDFYDITNGTAKKWTVPVAATDGTAHPENIDDLWHAAVNGRGRYFSAGDPTTLSASLNSALDSINAITGAAAAAATSSLQPVQGDNDIYVAQFKSVEWVGDLLAFTIDPSSGAISSTTTWSAKSQLDAKVPSSRAIYYPDPSGGSTLKAFTYANLSSDSYGSNFDNFCSKTGADGSAAPEQCATLDPTSLAAANSGTNLVSFLRGDQTLSYYRSRTSVLGDIVSAAPLFVGKPNFRYLENSYPTFQSDNATRTFVVLAGANDGMLHAFDRATGAERWAYVPSFVIPKLYKLADTSYSNNHDYFVDGSPQVGDIFVGGHWKTIVVGGLNAGGRGYYALDVTDPAAPKLLWEFSNSNLGLTFGNPIITKRADNTWVVVFTSGYNNVSPGDGNGRLFVLNADTGALITQIETFTSGTTPAGTTSAPSGLGKLNDWVDSERNNLALRFYGGDLLGNLWRFDLDSLVAPFGKALPLAQFRLSDGTPQSITVKPALALVKFNSVDYPVVYAATGRYLGTTDLTTTTTQSVYGIKDPLTDSSYGDIRSTSVLVTQTLTIGTDADGHPTRSIVSSPVDWSSKAGFRLDLPANGERVNVNPQVALNILFFATNIPNNDACTVGGSSFLYKLDIATGSTASGESGVATFMGDVLIEGLTTVQLGMGSDSGGDDNHQSQNAGGLETLAVDSLGNLHGSGSSGSSGAGALHRTSWRELVN